MDVIELIRWIVRRCDVAVLKIAISHLTCEREPGRNGIFKCYVASNGLHISQNVPNVFHRYDMHFIHQFIQLLTAGIQCILSAEYNNIK